MNPDLNLSAAAERLEGIRTEAATHRLLHSAPHPNLWARLLPPLRRLEGWIERHAGTGRTGSQVAARG